MSHLRESFLVCLFSNKSFLATSPQAHPRDPTLPGFHLSRAFFRQEGEGGTERLPLLHPTAPARRPREAAGTGCCTSPVRTGLGRPHFPGLCEPQVHPDLLYCGTSAQSLKKRVAPRPSRTPSLSSGCSTELPPTGALGTRGWPALVQRPVPRPPGSVALELFLGLARYALSLETHRCQDHPILGRTLSLAWFFGPASPAANCHFGIRWKSKFKRAGALGNRWMSSSSARLDSQAPLLPPPSLLALTWSPFASSSISLFLLHHSLAPFLLHLVFPLFSLSPFSLCFLLHSFLSPFFPLRAFPSLSLLFNHLLERRNSLLLKRKSRAGGCLSP